jgi:hypothetical protein
MVTFRARDSEQTLFDDWIAAVPQSDRETESAFTIADAKQPVFTPTVSSTAGLVVREIAPGGIAAFAVVFANGAPLAFRKIRAPTLPILFSFGGMNEA